MEVRIISTFTNEGLKLFDPKQKKMIISSEGKNAIQMRTSLDMDVRIKFVVKVALATGYYLFQDNSLKMLIVNCSEGLFIVFHLKMHVIMIQNNLEA